jgi:hypothetical protein
MIPADLVAKLNQCAATDFAGPRDHWFSWLAKFTTMVAVGLVLELPELVYELKSIAREWIPYFRYRIITLPRREHAAKIIAFVGWFLIVVGVAGERVAEVKVKDFDVRIQECSDARVSEATLESSEADARAAKNEKEAEQLRKETEAEHLERVRLEARIAPRRLSSKQIDELAAKLKPLAEKGQIHITITSSAFDVESIDFKRDFETAFIAGGWKPSIVSWNQMNKRGLEIGMLEDPATKQIPLVFVPVVQSVRDAISGVGVPCEILPLSPDDPVSLGKPEPKVLYLLVHSKPEAVFPDRNIKKSSKANDRETP